MVGDSREFDSITGINCCVAFHNHFHLIDLFVGVIHTDIRLIRRNLIIRSVNNFIRIIPEVISADGIRRLGG